MVYVLPLAVMPPLAVVGSSLARSGTGVIALVWSADAG
jgi:hypothetical protein